MLHPNRGFVAHEERTEQLQDLAGSIGQRPLHEDHCKMSHDADQQYRTTRANQGGVVDGSMG